MKVVSTTLCGAEGIATIAEALRSIAPHVDACIVVVTDGESQGTIRREALQAVPAHKLQFSTWAWSGDFGEARNAALDIATASGADWCVWVDSDETIEHGEEIRPFLEDITRLPMYRVEHGKPPEIVPEPAVMMAHSSGTYLQPRAIRLPCASRWDGRVHEAIPLTGPRFPRAVFCDREKTHEQILAKRLRDREACLRMIDERPGEPRWWYYAADAMAGLGMLVSPEEARERGHFADAAAMFKRCAEMRGWDEQAAWAAYRAAEIMTNVLGRHGEAVEMCAKGLVRHAGIAELAWMASLASYRAGRYEQAVYWSCLADVHGVPGLGSDSRALASRTLFREPKGITFGPAEVREHALRQLGDHEGAERARREREQRLADLVQKIEPAAKDHNATGSWGHRFAVAPTEWSALTPSVRAAWDAAAEAVLRAQRDP